MESKILVRIALLALPLALYEIVFSGLPSVQKALNRGFVSMFAGLVALYYAFLPVEISGMSMDFRGIPIVLSALYGGWMESFVSLSVFLLGQIMLGSSMSGSQVFTLSMLICLGFVIVVSGWFRRQRPHRRMLAKPQADAWGIHDLNRILESTVVLMEPQALMQSVILTLESEPVACPVYCIEGQLKQVCTNLVKNALEATPDGRAVFYQ